MPYGEKGQKVNAFAFEEETAGAKHDRFVWGNAAYAMGVNVTRAFKESGGRCRSVARSPAARCRTSPCTPRDLRR